MNDLIVIDNLWFSYGNQVILEKISGSIKNKDFLVIVGPNGSGKSTFLKLLMGLEVPLNGSIKIMDKLPREARKDIGYVPQYTFLDQYFPIDVLHVVLNGLIKNNYLFPWYSKIDIEKALYWLEKLEIIGLQKRRFGDLSGGQKQRVLIARALINNPKIIILDEPTANIDKKMEEEIFHIFDFLNKEKTIIIVSHNINIVFKFANKIMYLNKEGIIEDKNRITKDKLLSFYYSDVLSSQFNFEENF